MRRLLLAVVVLSAFGAGAAGIVVAQGAPPTVTVTLTAKRITLRGTEALQGGPTRFAIRGADSREHTFTIAALKAGVTLPEFERVLRRARGPEAVLEFIKFEGGGGLQARERRAVTATLRPGVTYVALDTAGDDPRRFPHVTFTVGAGQGTAVAPRPRAVVRMVNYAFRGARTLPREGSVRFRNAGRSPHFAIAFPLKPGADVRAAGRAIRSNDERAFERLMGGPPSEPQNVLSPGRVNDQELSFDRAGTYMLVCFFETRGKGHNERGMYRAVRVR